MDVRAAVLAESRAVGKLGGEHLARLDRRAPSDRRELTSANHDRCYYCYIGDGRRLGRVFLFSRYIVFFFFFILSPRKKRVSFFIYPSISRLKRRVVYTHVWLGFFFYVNKRRS